MKTAPSSRSHRIARLSAAGALLLAAAAQTCHAQFAAPPGPGGFLGGGPSSGPPSASQTPPPSLPDGVSLIYALQGSNQILTYATPEGYDRLLELIRNLDGDLDLLRTKVVSVEARTSDLAALGVTPSPGGASWSAQDNARLLTALQNGSLRATETLRITTRENTAVTTLLRRPGARNTDGGTPFTLIPREGKNGMLTLEIHEPTAVQVSVQSGQTAVVPLPGLTTDTVRMLFLTPTVLASESRPLH